MQLANKELWNQFHQHETEMVITKTGRRMFPHLNVTISDLDPSADYCLFLEITLAENCRFKHSRGTGWTMASQAESQSPHSLYLHPESPAKGSHWMSQDISFSRVKLTNTTSPPMGQIVLSSMHRYQPKIVVIKSSNPQFFGYVPSMVFSFPETQFIAVTAYQNDEITKLKINHNPFAKGFRENGKSSIKKKELEEVKISGGKRSPSPLPPTPPPPPVYSHTYGNTPAPNNGYFYPPNSVYGQWCPVPYVYYYQYPPIPYMGHEKVDVQSPQISSYPYVENEQLEVQKPKKLKFSVDGIISSTCIEKKEEKDQKRKKVRNFLMNTILNL